MVGLVSLYEPGAADGAEVEVVVTGEADEQFLSALGGYGPLTVHYTDDTALAMTAFERGDVDALIDVDRSEADQLLLSITVPQEDLRLSIIVLQLREGLEHAEHQYRIAHMDRLETDPVPIPDAPNASPYFGFTYTVLVPLLLFLPVFISGSIIVDSITEEIDRGTLELLRVAPIDLPTIIDGKVLAAIAIVPLQVMLWLALLRINGIPIEQLPIILVLVTAIASAVVAIGAAIALVTVDRRQAQFLYSIAVIGLLVGAILLPEQPANTVARLAIGSADSVSYAMVGLYVIGGVCSLIGMRWIVGKWRP